MMEAVSLSNRLQTVADMVTGRRVADIGCDHGFVSIYLAQDARRCGMGRRLYAAMEERLRDMGVLNLYACITCPDREDEYVTRNSMEFHSHLGFRQVAEFRSCGYKFGRWYNMVWMEKIIADHPDRQPDVIPFAQIPPEIYC